MAAEFLAELHIIGPLMGGVVLVVWVLVQRLRDGVAPGSLLLDRQFMTAVFFTGALLSIYLSCVHYLNVAAERQADVTSP